MAMTGCRDLVTPSDNKDDTPVNPQPSGGDETPSGGDQGGNSGEQGGEGSGEGQSGESGGEGSGEGQGEGSGGEGQGGESGGEQGGEGSGEGQGGESGGEGQGGEGGEQQVTLEGIAFVHMPINSYVVGDTIDLTGTVIVARYSDGTTPVIDNSELQVEGFDTSAPGTNIEVTLSYQGFSVVFTINVVAAPVSVPTHTLCIIKADNDESIASMTIDSEEKEYVVQNVLLEAGDKIRFKMSEDESDYRGYSQLKLSAESKLNFDNSGEDDYIRVVKDGKYNFYVGINADKDGDYVGKSIWAVRQKVAQSLFAAYNGGDILVGSQLAISQVVVQVEYDDSTKGENVAEQAVLKVGEENAVGYIFNEVKEYTINVTYQGMNASFKVNVIENFVADPNYYIIGSFCNWEKDNMKVLTAGTKTELDEGNGIDRYVEGTKQQYFLKDLEVTEPIEFKFFQNKQTIDGSDTYMPAGGSDSNIQIKNAGVYDIYFAPEGEVSAWGGSFRYIYKHEPAKTGIHFEYTGVPIVQGHAIQGDMILKFVYEDTSEHGMESSEMAHVQFFIGSSTEPVGQDYIWNTVGSFTLKAVYDDGNLHFEDSTIITVVAPELHSYSIELNTTPNATTVDMELDDEHKPEGVEHQFKYTFTNLDDGLIFTFFEGEAFLALDKLTVENSNGAIRFNDQDKLVSVTEEENYTIYLKVYGNGSSYQLYCPDCNQTPYFRGGAVGWGINKDYAFTPLGEQVDGKDQYVLRNINLIAGQQFKIFYGGNWTPDGDNLVVAETGTFDIYFVKEGGVAAWSDYGGYCYLKNVAPKGLAANYTGASIVSGEKLDVNHIELTLTDAYDHNNSLAWDTEGVVYKINDSIVDLSTQTFSSLGNVQIAVTYKGLNATMTVQVVAAEVHATSVSITESGPLTIYIGDNPVQLHTTILPANSTDSVVWSSSAEDTISINESTGEISGLNVGSSTITATAGAVSASILVNVQLRNYVKAGSFQAPLVENTSFVPAGNEVKEYHLSEPLVVANDNTEIEFYLDGSIVTQFGPSGDDVGHNRQNNGRGADNDGVAKIFVKKADTVDIYIKTYDDGGTSYWITEGASIHSYGLVGSSAALGAWDTSKAVPLVEDNEFHSWASVEVSLNAGDEFKVVTDNNYDDPTYGKTAVTAFAEDIQKAFDITTSGDGNIICKEDGVYTIIFDYATGDIEIRGIITPLNEIYGLSLDGSAQTFTLHDEDIPVGAVHQLKAVMNLDDEDTIAFTKNGAPITVTANSGNNNIKNVDGQNYLEVIHGGDNLELYFKIMSDGTYEVWLTGYQSPAPTTETYTFTTDKNWLANDGAVIVAWVWGGSYGSGEWVECSVDASGVITVDLRPDAENITFIRRGADMPNGWTKNTNYWNRVPDGKHQALSSGVYSYNISSINWD